MVPTPVSKIWLVFRHGYEYVFMHGETSMLTVTLSPTAITLFNQCHVKADDLSKQAAEWAQFINRTSGIVDLNTESNDLSAFCQYYFQNEALEKRVC